MLKQFFFSSADYQLKCEYAEKSFHCYLKQNTIYSEPVTNHFFVALERDDLLSTLTQRKGKRGGKVFSFKLALTDLSFQKEEKAPT